MHRKGKVAAINAARGMVAIETEDGGYTIIELLSDWELTVGDSMRWSDGYGLGGQMYENLSAGTRCEVYVQNHDVSRENVRQQLMMR